MTRESEQSSSDLVYQESVLFWCLFCFSNQIYVHKSCTSKQAQIQTMLLRRHCDFCCLHMKFWRKHLEQLRYEDSRALFMRLSLHVFVRERSIFWFDLRDSQKRSIRVFLRCRLTFLQNLVNQEFWQNLGKPRKKHTTTNTALQIHTPKQRGKASNQAKGNDKNNEKFNQRGTRKIPNAKAITQKTRRNKNSKIWVHMYVDPFPTPKSPLHFASPPPLCTHHPTSRPFQCTPTMYLWNANTHRSWTLPFHYGC